jgi:hypothetical protein
MGLPSGWWCETNGDELWYYKGSGLCAIVRSYGISTMPEVSIRLEVVAAIVADALDRKHAAAMMADKDE